ncbi:hypothetical protein R3398_16270 [Rossellomorea marisflavi]|nr:hypothetical protein [Rossellomorea marisflavi]MDW4527922.1 hypothetical protein [Rossellomorea marisflavi]
MEQQPMNISQGTVYQQPPQVITTKDSLYINDMLAWNLNAMKKCHFAAAHSQDPSIRSMLDRCGQMHQRHYEQLMSHLQKHTIQQS